MTWNRQTITLECGCMGAGAWDELYVGLERRCPKHGQSPIVRMARVYESTGSRNASLGLLDPA